MLIALCWCLRESRRRYLRGLILIINYFCFNSLTLFDPVEPFFFHFSEAWLFGSEVNLKTLVNHRASLTRFILLSGMNLTLIFQSRKENILGRKRVICLLIFCCFAISLNLLLYNRFELKILSSICIQIGLFIFDQLF